MADKAFIQLNRDYDKSIHKYPNDFNLLAIIALRAKRTDSYENKKLEIGEAYIGDFENYGLSEQEYRTSKKRLQERGFITTKPTPKGTIAKLVNSSVFNINSDVVATDTITPKATDEQRTSNGQTTTNNNDKNVKNDKNEQTNGVDVLKNLPSIEVEGLSKTYGCSQSQVRGKASDLHFQYSSKGLPVHNPIALLRKALLLDFGYRKPTVTYTPAQTLPKPEELVSDETVKQLMEQKKQLLGGARA